MVTLASLSGSIDSGQISLRLARILKAETGEPVLIVQLVPAGTTLALKDWPLLRRRSEDGFALASHIENLPGDVQRLVMLGGHDSHDAGLMATFINHLRRDFTYVLLDLGHGQPAPLIEECVIRSDLNCLLLRQDAAEYLEFNRFARLVHASPGGELAHIKPLLCLATDERALEIDDAFKPLPTSRIGYIRNTPAIGAETDEGAWTNRLLDSDLRRLAREISHRQVGLALSSGGAKGFAHVGVIQTLEEHGIEIDYIAGCSMGAYVGALWSYGLDGNKLDRLAHEVEGRFGMLGLIDPVMPPRRGFIRGFAIKRRLKRSIGEAHFVDALTPIRIVATHLGSLGRVVFSSGEIAAAVHASFAIPGVCEPVEIDGENYIDGGISDPMPVDVLREIGIERVIAVNTIPPPAYFQCREEMRREQREAERGRFNLWKFLDKHLNYFARGNILDNLVSCFYGAQMRVAEESSRDADLVLRPLAWDASWHDFARPGKYIALGRQVATEHISDIKALVHRKEPSHEHEPAHLALAHAA
jgi:NTE family protein